MTARSIRVLCATLLVAAACAAGAREVKLLNVSYDPTRELYQEINTAFARFWKSKTGDDVTITQSHGGSGKQTRAVIDGLEADVVTLGVATDIDALHTQAGLVPENWQTRLPNNSCPFASTIVFLVHRGGRAHVKTWDDLAQPGVSVIAPNPKTSGGARWIYLAAYGWALRKNHGDAAAARHFIEQFYRNVPVMDEGARGSTITFVQRGIGDVLVIWESDALMVVNSFGKGRFDIIYPPESIRAEPPVSVVDKYVDAHGTRSVAEAYLNFLYAPESQQIAARHYFRPSLESVASQNKTLFPEMKMFTVAEVFGSWAAAQKAHFAEGGLFDQIARSRR
jgi:sulfate/thiosulfate transport system substrate-binding protein